MQQLKLSLENLFLKSLYPYSEDIQCFYIKNDNSHCYFIHMIIVKI